MPHSYKTHRSKKFAGSYRLSQGQSLNRTDQHIIFSGKILYAFAIWICFHLLALITSYEQIPFFNTAGEPSPQQFWPFVNFIDEYFVASFRALGASGTKLKFNGLFVNYDWTEFCSYAGGISLLTVFYYIYKKAG